MPIVLGPILRFQGIQHNQWKVSVLLVTENESIAPAVRYGVGRFLAGMTRIGERDFDTAMNWQMTRHDITVEMMATEQQIDYEVDNVVYRFTIPAVGALPRCSYAACNGFSDAKLIKKVDSPNQLWNDLLAKHAQNSFHLLLMGGDQLYTDSMWQELPSLHAWSESDNRSVLPLTDQMRREVGDFFYRIYVKRWAQKEVKQALASIPTLMMWDDHDILDGWGSYPKEQQESAVFQHIFEQAKECFVLYQLHGASTDGGILPNQQAFNSFYQIGKLGILVLDLRSERTMEQVISSESWDVIYQKLDNLAVNQLDHLFVMSSIPVVHADFNALESLFGIIPGRQELEDDLRDQWLSRPHRYERIRLIHRLLDFSANKKCRVTLLSGDVHVAALGMIESSRHATQGNTHIINQLTSSGIVHPSPNAVVLFFLNHIGGEIETIDRDITARMTEFPTTNRCFIGSRNWLSLEPDDINLQRRYWANWWVEGEDAPYTKVIHAAS